MAAIVLVLVVAGCAGSSRKAVGVEYLEPLPSGWSIASTIEHDCTYGGADANYSVRWVALDVSGGQDEALDRFAEHLSDAGLDVGPAEALAFEPWRSVHGSDGGIELWAGTQSSFHDAATEVNGIESGARDWEPTVGDAEVIVRLQPVGPCLDRPT